jgi:methyl-accepting chemotaxis protein
MAGGAQKKEGYGDGGLGGQQSQRRYLVTLAALLAGVILMVGTVSLYTISNLEAAVAEQEQAEKQLKSVLDHSRDAETNFRTMIQEWKNLLLRGNDLDDFEKYSKAYGDRADAVLVSLNAVRQGALQSPEILTHIVSLSTEIRTLKTRYDAAAAEYRPSDVLSLRGADARVRGADRPLHTEFAALNKLIYLEVEAVETAKHTQVLSEVGTTENVILFAISACLALAGVILVMTLRVINAARKQG